MRRLAWLTDLHLDFVTRDRLARLLYEVRARRPDAVLVGGDTAQSPTVAAVLRDIQSQLDLPVFFVLGNHDFYRGGIAATRAAIRELCREVPQLRWLPDAGVVSLADRTALVGHDGWGDARSGDFLASTVLLNDYRLIDEFREASECDDRDVTQPRPSAILSPALRARLHALGDECADHLRRVVSEALRRHERVIVLTHVPPFREACWHAGRVSDDNWAPHFVCQAAGEALREAMRLHPTRRLTVLCGHTHSPGRAEILPNLVALTAAAEYGDPRLQQIVTVP